MDVVTLQLAKKYADEVAGGGVVYSTEETVIGTWIDGKPLYRKVYTGFLSKWTTTETVTVMEAGFRSTKRLKNAWGNVVVKYSATYQYDYAFPSGYSYNNTQNSGYILVAVDNNGTLVIAQQWGAVGIGSSPFELVVEYTKTTDQATVELPAVLAAQPATALSADSSVTEAMASDAAVASQI